MYLNLEARIVQWCNAFTYIIYVFPKLRLSLSPKHTHGSTRELYTCPLSPLPTILRCVVQVLFESPEIPKLELFGKSAKQS